MLLTGETLIAGWPSGGRFLWLALCSSVCFEVRESKMFAETRSRLRETYCLRRADVFFFCGDSLSLLPRSDRPLTSSKFGFVGARVTSCVTGRERWWQRCRSHDRVILSFCPRLPLWLRLVLVIRQMVDVDAEASNCGSAVSDYVRGGASGVLRFALPKIWGRNSFAGGGWLYTKSLAA